jgi:photosystem II cytochrome c550
MILFFTFQSASSAMAIEFDEATRTVKLNDQGVNDQGETITLSQKQVKEGSIFGLVDYLHNPTTYDGAKSIAELHPSTSSADIFASMRNLTEEDLVAIAGHIMTQPRILGNQRGGGKTIR